MNPYFFASAAEAAVHLLRLRQNASVSLAHRSGDFAAVGTRSERDARGMAKTFELACVRVCFDIDRPEDFERTTPVSSRLALSCGTSSERYIALFPDQERLLSLEL